MDFARGLSYLGEGLSSKGSDKICTHDSEPWLNIWPAILVGPVTIVPVIIALIVAHVMVQLL